MQNGLDGNGEAIEAYGVRALYESWRGDDDPLTHAPSEYVWRRRKERAARDLHELEDLWREEQKARQRERAPIMRGRFHREPHADDRRQERKIKAEKRGVE